MKFPIGCLTCVGEGKKDFSIHLLDANNEGVYQIVCSYGHKTTAVFQQPRFCILAEMGVVAFRDAYYRESIFNFSSCMERFMEYYVQVITTDMNIQPQHYDSTWKNMARQSERQMGAFLATYMIATKSSPPVLSSHLFELRNNVVHRGYIPSSDDAKKYAEAVLEIVTKEYKNLQLQHSSGVGLLLARRKEQMNEKYSPNRDAAVIGWNTIIDHVINGSYNFDSYLEFLNGTKNH